MTEIGTAYLSIVASTDGIPRQIRAALGQADVDATRAGQQMGSKMSGALGMALKTGGAAAAAGATAAIGTALVQGFKRLDAIDQAKGKLSALGASTQTTAKVMDSALAAVKGTAYGLGDAATISASAMAAGVKPGQELTKYLSMTADTAAIAGTSLSDMGAILNQVQTGQMAYTDDLNQLADRGIPIYQWLAKEAGVTGGEVKKMAGDGKISSEMFFKAIEANVGGAAKTIGSSTVRGGLENLKAAMGRLGAAALEPGFNRLPGALSTLTGRIDALTPKAKELATAFDAKVFGEWAPKLKEAMAAFERTGTLDQTRDVITQMMSAMGAAAPSIGQIAASLAQASAALGVSGWQLFLTALQAGTTTLGVLNPLLKTTADLMQSNQGLVTALVAGWLAFKTVPSLLSNVTGALSPMSTGLRTAGSNMSAFASAYSQSVTWMKQANPQMSTAGAHLNVLRQNGMNASGAMTALKGGVGLLTGAMGGPLGIALAGGMVALGQYSQHQADAAAKVAEHKAFVDQLTESINFNTGAIDANGKKQIYDKLSSQGAFKNANTAGISATSEQIQKAGEGDKSALAAVNQQIDDKIAEEISKNRDNYISDDQAANGVSTYDYAQALRGNVEKQKTLQGKGIGDGTKGFWSELSQQEMPAATRAAIDLANALGLSNDGIRDTIANSRQEAEALGLVGQRMTDLAGKFQGQGKGFSIEVDSKQVEGTEDMLKQLGFTLQTMPNGQVKVTANTDEAAQKLQWVTQNVNILNALKANPKIDLEKSQFDAKNGDAKAALSAIDRTQVSPQAGLIIDKLLQGKAVSMGELETLSKTTANPQADMQIQKVMEKIGIVNKGLDDAARKRTAEIEVVSFGSTVYGGYTDSTGRRQAGGRASGGQVFGPGGPKDDAFLVPLSNREWVHQVAAVDYYGTDVMDAINNRRIPREVLHPGRANGGQALRDLAEGKGASRPLTGSPYVWGGVNWGDCSGAMSAFARLAAGLSPFGGRFSTATESSYLQQLGFTSGRGGSGDLRFGWYNGGPGGGHTAGTLPDGTNIEMGGSYGGGMLGGSVGADSPQFTDHAYLKIGPSWTDPGSDGGGFVLRPDGKIVFEPGNGDYSAGGGSLSGGGGGGSSSSSGSGASGKTSLSQRLGGAASAFIEGQVGSLLSVLSVNDSPGVLGAIGEYENQARAARENKQKITDPGTNKPGDGEDLGNNKAPNAGTGSTPPAASPAPTPAAPAPAPAEPSTGNAIKDAFRSGLRALWHQGKPWTDTDWIINKESTWNPKARNGKYFGLGQYSPEAWAAAGKQPTDDPRTQGEVFDNYVGGRYGDPSKARAHHEANNWYDQGGLAVGTGLLAKNVLTPERVLSPRETVAFEKMVDRDFEGGGGTDQVIARLDQLIDLLSKKPIGQVNYNLPADRGVERAQKIAESRRRAGLAAF